MFDHNWIVDQQGEVCSHTNEQQTNKSEESEKQPPWCSNFTPSPDKDPYFQVRKVLRPDLHKEIYPDIPII